MFMVVLACAELGNAVWPMSATKLSMPVSATQTITGALVGAGIAAQTYVRWRWASESVSQIAASWGIAPLISGALAALLFATIKHRILAREDAFKWALRLIPVYLAFTASMLALFMVVEAPGSPSLEDIGAGPASGAVLGVFFGSLLSAYIFFKPYFWRRLVKGDSRIVWYHSSLGPLLYRDDPPVYFPSKNTESTINYYEDAYENVTAGRKEEERAREAEGLPPVGSGILEKSDSEKDNAPNKKIAPGTSARLPADVSNMSSEQAAQLAGEYERGERALPATVLKPGYVPPYERFIGLFKILHG